MKQKLFEAAIKARENAHAPYSKFKVGAAVLLENNQVFTGANIENASYGATVCAERVAIWNAISTSGVQKIKEMTIVTKEGWPPCGLCRQVMSEFSDDSTLVHIADLNGVLKSYHFSELMPMAFTL